MQTIDTFKNRLQYAMDIRGIKQVDLVEKVRNAIDKTLLNKYLAGITKAGQKNLTILADALNVNEIWLLGYDAPMERTLTNNTDELGNIVTSIPIIGTVKAGYDYLAQENWIDTINVETSLVGDGSEYFALQVKGDSMAPVFIEGDTVIIHKQNDCENNQIAIVLVNGNEGTIKKVRKTETGIILQPLNPAYTPLIFSNNEIKDIPITIVGIVKQLKREF